MRVAGGEKLRMDRLFEQYLKYVGRHWQPDTFKRYEITIRYFKPHVDPEMSFLDLTWEEIEECLDAIRERGNCLMSVDSHLTTLKSFCQWVVEHYRGPDNECLENPASMVRYRLNRQKMKDEIKQRFLTQEEYDKVLGVADPLEGDAIRFLANTGLRRREFITLDWSMFIHDYRTLRVVGKGRKERFVPLDSPIIQGIITRYRRHSSPPFVLPAYRQDRNRINKRFRKLAAKAGIPSFGPHALRHFFATRAVEQGVPIKLVSVILGHSSVDTTERVYTHLTVPSLHGYLTCFTS